ncbi:MAG: prenyltransferase [Planctomycetes bacterium]|jgi:hypothetical protein|nr:prenyltransferase [Planctomycetota bacterium]
MRSGRILLLLGVAGVIATGASSQEARQAVTVRARDAQRSVLTPELEAATRDGLAYLARTQSADGAWRGDVGRKWGTSYRVTRENAAHVGVTALALMAFLACGELADRGKYGEQLGRAADFLVKSCEDNGYITTNGTKMYSHAFAVLALAELYGMTKRNVKPAMQRAIHLMCDAQNREGGWRYHPFAQESDMSITVCQVMALRAARNAGVSVPVKVIENAVNYVRRSVRRPGENIGSRGGWGWRRRQNEPYGPGVFKYQLRYGTRSTFALTAAGVVTLYGAGIYKDPVIERSLDFMLENAAEHHDYYENHMRFYYANYYAVQAFFVAGGDRWRHYFEGLREFLLERQGPDGSWPCDVGPGRDFSTAAATLILAIPYGYLPIFQR